MTDDDKSGLSTAGESASVDGNRQESLGDDLLIGAEAIAREMKWTIADGRWNRRRVYYLAEHGDAPIHRVKGLGICARWSALWAYFEKLDRQRLGD